MRPDTVTHRKEMARARALGLVHSARCDPREEAAREETAIVLSGSDIRCGAPFQRPRVCSNIGSTLTVIKPRRR